MKLQKYRDLYSCQIDNAESINQALLAGFEAHRDTEDVRRSHYFDGRYENIYISDKAIPELALIKQTVREQTAKITGRDAQKLKVGLWFNAMGPGHTTTAHRHDDDDEIMSAVYYVEVPDNSGMLVLSEGRFVTTVTPEAGLMVLFPPDMMHEVTRNQSDRMRLSLGINVGPIDDEQDDA